jgi:hypothetical protein
MGSLAEIITAVAALLAALTAFYAQLKVGRMQKVLNDRQKLLDENQRILNEKGMAIPVGDEGVWDDYWAARKGGKNRMEASNEALKVRGIDSA